MRWMWPVVLAVAVCWGGMARAQTPTITYCVPAALAPGKTTTLTVYGTSLGVSPRLWTSFPAEAVLARHDRADQASFDVKAPADVAPGVVGVRVVHADGASNLLPLLIDDLPTEAEIASHKTVATAQPLPFRSAVDGACEELAFDYYKFQGKAGQRISVEVVAARLGSKMDPVIRLLDSSGREISYCDDDPVVAPDARFSCRLPADGEYVIELRDVGYEGGPQYRYHLRLGDFPLAGAALPHSGRADKDAVVEVEPNDKQPQNLEMPVTLSGRFEQAKDRDCYGISLKKGQRVEFRAATRSLGSPCDAALQLLKADGASVARSKGTEAGEALISYAPTEDGSYVLAVEELNQRGGADLLYRLTVGPAAGFGLTVDSEKVDVREGGEFSLKVTAARREYKGAISLSFEWDGKELESSGELGEGKTEAQMKVKAPAGVAAGRLVYVKIKGRPAGDGGAAVVASTAPALKKVWPRLLYPPAEWDGVISVNVK